MKKEIGQDAGRPEPKRRYRMAARAEASAATEQRILEAAQRLFGELPYDRVALRAVATRAGVTVQTVLRRFATKERLFAAVAEWASPQIRGGRDASPVGNAAEAVRDLIDSYEGWGDYVLHLLAQESRTEAIRAAIVAGRRYHRAWVERCFGSLLGDVPPPERERRLTQLVAVTDLYVWKLLRRDLGLPRDETEAAVRDLVRRVVEEG